MCARVWVYMFVCVYGALTRELFTRVAAARTCTPPPARTICELKASGGGAT